MAMFTVGLRSPPYLIELSKLQQVRMLWGRALPKILPSSRFPTHFGPSFLVGSHVLGDGGSLVLADALANSSHMTSPVVLGTEGQSQIRERWGGLGCYQS